MGSGNTVSINGSSSDVFSTAPNNTCLLYGNSDESFMNNYNDSVRAFGLSDSSCFNGASTSVVQLFSFTSNISSIFEVYSGLNGTGALDNITYNWTAGGSEQAIFNLVGNGVAEETRNFTGANDTGQLVSAAANMADGSYINITYSYDKDGNEVGFTEKSGKAVAAFSPNGSLALGNGGSIDDDGWLGVEADYGGDGFDGTDIYNYSDDDGDDYGDDDGFDWI